MYKLNTTNQFEKDLKAIIPGNGNVISNRTGCYYGSRTIRN